MTSETFPELTPEIVVAAAERIKGVAHKTPIFTSRSLNARVGGELFLKGENFQRVGAFKFRGAYNALSQLTAEQKAAGVVTHSSGNHAQGIALAAKLLGIPATIVMPHDAPAIKREATAAYGATIVPCEAIEREEITARLIQEKGYTLIHPYDNSHIIAGQGTAAWELFDEVGELDYLFVPVGGGGLISGSALAAAGRSPDCQVIGVEPELAADAGASWRGGQVVTLSEVPATIADGLRTRAIGRRNLVVMGQFVHDMLTISEEAILETMLFLWQRLKIVVEPSGAVALAPLFSGQFDLAGKRAGVILSGGNVNLVDFREPILPPLVKVAKTAVAAAAPKKEERPRILVCEPIHEEGLAILRSFADVDCQFDLEREELINIIPDYQAVVVGRRKQIGERVVKAGYRLQAIGCAGGWLDNVDVSTARAYGMEVVYSPGSNTVAVAEHTLSLMLSLSSQNEDPLRRGLAGKTVGIVGFGRIGRQVAQRALAFDMRVLVNQPRLTPELALSARVEARDLHDLLREADFISLHVPFKAETETLLGAAEFALLKPGAYLINTAHTELLDDGAALAALADGRLAGAALATFSPEAEMTRPSVTLRQHPHVISAAHVTAFIGDKAREAAVAVAEQMRSLLQTRPASESLSLEVAPIDQVLPHEQIDDKRVARLMSRLEEDGLLVNPPIVTPWRGRFVILDGATRFTAMQRLGYPHVIVQVVDPASKEFTLHTWYHAISSERPFTDLQAHLAAISGLRLSPLATANIANVWQNPAALCYFLDREGAATLAEADPSADRLAVMNALVASYTRWGGVERTLLTDLGRLLGQFPQMTAVAVFPQFKPETVFDVASRGDFLPAGLTRFVIPGRILRLNADLGRLKRDEPLAAKRAWLNQYLEEKLARSRLRYYQEPVVLLDE
jgi:threo-3-hydroxy-L-aspartate ammonia-lyase